MKQQTSPGLLTTTHSTFREKGDHRATLNLYDAYSPVVYGLVCKILPRKEDAESIMYVLFNDPALHMSDHVNRRSSKLQWLLNTARIMAIKKLYDLSATPVIDGQLQDLSLTEKMVFVLYQFHHYSTSVIGDMLSMPVSFVGVILQKAVDKSQYRSW